MESSQEEAESSEAELDSLEALGESSESEFSSELLSNSFSLSSVSHI